MMDLRNLFSNFSQTKAGVIGDVMLDTYLWGHVERISPEAPVPVVALERRELRIGGAGNVALNLASLDVQVSVFSVIGDDTDGQLLEGLLKGSGIDCSYMLRSGERVTTNKARVMGRNQQMLRLDSETTADLGSRLEEEMLDRLRRYIETERPQIIIFEDYNKGVLTPRLIREAIALCRHHAVLTAVDPKKKNFFAYEGVTIFKPNLKEVREGLNILLEDVGLASLRQAHGLLAEKMGHHLSFITLSERGVFFEDDKGANIIPAHVRNIADVSGAGDTVIAVASLVYSATRDASLMAKVANIAGGLVCEEVGTAAIDKGRLLAECMRLLG